MNLSEFKAWFEGFTESMDGPPGEKAWKRIQGGIESIKNDEPTTRHVFHEYYERPWRRWYDVTPHRNHLISASSARQSFSHGRQKAMTDSTPIFLTAAASTSSGFDSVAAFNKLGRAEALSLANVKAIR